MCRLLFCVFRLPQTAERLPENHVQAACNPSSANCLKQFAPGRFRFAAPQTVRRSRRIVGRGLRLRQYAAWLPLRWRGWSGFPQPACSRIAAIRRPTRPISLCPSRLRGGFRQARTGFCLRCFAVAFYPIKTEVMLIELKANSSLNISILSCGSRSAAV